MKKIFFLIVIMILLGCISNKNGKDMIFDDFFKSKSIINIFDTTYSEVVSDGINIINGKIYLKSKMFNLKTCINYNINNELYLMFSYDNEIYIIYDKINKKCFVLRFYVMGNKDSFCNNIQSIYYVDNDFVPVFCMKKMINEDIIYTEGGYYFNESNNCYGFKSDSFDITCLMIKDLNSVLSYYEKFNSKKQKKTMFIDGAFLKHEPMWMDVGASYPW